MNITEFFREPAPDLSRPSQSVSATNTPRAYSHTIREGLVIYRRPRTALWQCRYRLPDGTWHRLSTGCKDADTAAERAIALAQQGALRHEIGLPSKRVLFGTVAQEAQADIQRIRSQGSGKVVYRDYEVVMDRYLIPFFGRLSFEQITPDVLRDFDGWRISKIGRPPKASTLRTHASAFNRVVEIARHRGLLPVSKPAPALTIKGRPGEARPSFTQPEIDHLLAFMPQWIHRGRLSLEQVIRPLLRDYVEFLLYTGIRHGTEARGIRWQHLQWHTEGDHKYLRVWVSGKTGPRLLIARAGAVACLERLAQRNHGESLNDLIESALPSEVFVCHTGYRPHGFEGSFRKLMRDSGLLKDTSGKNRTLYSLRHTYATFALRAGISIHTIARQMGTSVLMLEKHYSKLTPMMNAAQLGK